MLTKKIRKISSQKKGTIGPVLKEIAGLLIAGIVIVVIVGIIASLLNIFLTEKDFDSTIESFNVLNERINALINDDNYANTNMLYFLDDGYILVGYSYKDPAEMRTCKKGILFWSGSESLMNTRGITGGICNNKACLCIYADTISDDFDEDLQPPLECRSFDKKVVFLAPSTQNEFCGSQSGWHPESDPDYYQGENNYKFFILDGFDTEEVYLDKYESGNGNIFIYMAVYKEGSNNPAYDKVLERAKFIQERFEGSSE